MECYACCYDVSSKSHFRCFCGKYICKECIEIYLQTLVDDNFISKIIQPPCKCDFDMNFILADHPLLKILKNIYNNNKINKIYNNKSYNDTVNFIDSNILTYHCKSCDSAFIDFNGCTALVCNMCRSNICVYCLDVFQNSSQCHAHVKNCKFNINDKKSYYSKNSTIIHEPRINYQLIKIIKQISVNIQFKIARKYKSYIKQKYIKYFAKNGIIDQNDHTFINTFFARKLNSKKHRNEINKYVKSLNDKRARHQLNKKRRKERKRNQRIQENQENQIIDFHKKMRLIHYGVIFILGLIYYYSFSYI
jgi:hypothetical protein